MIPTSRTERFDAIVVGARCAGAATALLLARSGARVLCVDYGQPGTDTLSTHALMRAGVVQLHRWGVLPEIKAAQTPPIRKTVFHYGNEVLEVDIRPAFGTDALFAPRRTVLDHALVKAAAGASVTFRFGTACVGLIEGTSGQVAGARLRGPDGKETVVKAGIVIGADGRRSTIARQVRARSLWQGQCATSVVYGYFEGLPNHGYRWFYEPGASGGVIPTNDGLSCVFLATPPSVFERDLRGKSETVVRQLTSQLLPALAEVLENARLASPLLAFGGQPGHLRQSHGPGWALVGDAGYFKDPITAHGITDALRDAEILANSIVAGTPEAYQKVRDGLAADFIRETEAIASFNWSLEEVKARHLSLNTAMKQGQNWILGQDVHNPVAA